MYIHVYNVSNEASLFKEDTVGFTDTDPHGSALFWEAGSGPELNGALKSRFRSCRVEAKNGAMEGRGRSKWSRGGS